MQIETSSPVVDEVSYLRTEPINSAETDQFKKSARKAYELDGVSPQLRRTITMKFLSGKSGVSSKGKDDITAYDLFALATPPYNLDHISKLYDMSSFHHGAVDAKVSNIVGLGYKFLYSKKTNERIEQIESDDGTDKARRKANKVASIMDTVFENFNLEYSFSETLSRALTDYETTGLGYIEVGRDNRGVIGYVGHVSSKDMRVRLARDGYVQVVGGKVTFFRNFGDRKTADPIGKDPNPNEIICLKKYSPTSAYYGVPDIVSAKSAIAGNEFASRYNLDYFENKAVPRYLITLKGATFSDTAEQSLLEFFETSLKGQNHRTLYIPLPADDPNRKVEFKMEPIESNVQESSFDRYQTANRDEILMAHRVPVSKIGIPNNVSLAMARDADKTFKEQVCNPTQRLVEQVVNKIVREFTDIVVFKLNELTLTDENTQASIDEIYLRMQVYTPNEVRARKGMPALPDGDEVIELNAQNKAEQTEQATGNRKRDQDRSSQATDDRGEARSPKGDGRTYD